MPTYKWIAKWDMDSPYDNDHEKNDEIRTLRWKLDIDPESYYTLEELREMEKEDDQEAIRDIEGK